MAFVVGGGGCAGTAPTPRTPPPTRQFARQLLAKGNRVHATARSPASASRLADLATKSGGGLTVSALDVADPASITAWAAGLAGQAKTLDVRVKGGGGGGRGGVGECGAVGGQGVEQQHDGAGLSPIPPPGDRLAPMCNRYGYLAPVSRLADAFSEIRIPLVFEGGAGVIVLLVAFAVATQRIACCARVFNCTAGSRVTWCDLGAASSEVAE